MKIARVVLAVIITLAMLYIARTNSRGRPEFVTHSENGYTFEMTTVPKLIEHESGFVTVNVQGIDNDPTRLDKTLVVFRTSQNPGGRDIPADRPEDFRRVNMTDAAEMARLAAKGIRLGDLPLPDSTRPGDYLVPVTAGAKGGRFHYYFEVALNSGPVLATFVNQDGEPFFLRYIGEVPILVLVSHILFIFATVFCVALAAVHALRVMTGRGGLAPMARYLFWAAVFCFIGGYPFGIPMNYYAFNGLWEGVPFGTDATDNKTQLLFVYLLFASLATLGTFTGGRFGRDLFAPRTLGWIGLGAFAVMLFIYLIPHSIQFEPGFTYAFCYSWTGVVVALYLLGLWRSRRAA